jgi:flagellar motility protein MotE (MotC chaperone)
MKMMQDAFESRLGSIEKANSIALNNLQQEQTRKDEEIKQLKEKLARLETDLNRIIGNGEKNNGN